MVTTLMATTTGTILTATILMDTTPMDIMGGDGTMAGPPQTGRTGRTERAPLLHLDQALTTVARDRVNTTAAAGIAQPTAEFKHLPTKALAHEHCAP